MKIEGLLPLKGREAKIVTSPQIFNRNVVEFVCLFVVAVDIADFCAVDIFEAKFCSM